MNRQRRPDAINPSPKKNIDLLGRQSTTPRVLKIKVGPGSEKGSSE
jgi:hypothetical protein